MVFIDLSERLFKSTKVSNGYKEINQPNNHFLNLKKGVFPIIITVMYVCDIYISKLYAGICNKDPQYRQTDIKRECLDCSFQIKSRSITNAGIKFIKELGLGLGLG